MTFFRKKNHMAAITGRPLSQAGHGGHVGIARRSPSSLGQHAMWWCHVLSSIVRRRETKSHPRRLICIFFSQIIIASLLSYHNISYNMTLYHVHHIIPYYHYFLPKNHSKNHTSSRWKTWMRRQCWVGTGSLTLPYDVSMLCCGKLSPPLTMNAYD